jgi:hypothetical protein
MQCCSFKTWDSFFKERILKEEQAKREKEQQDKMKAQKTSPTATDLQPASEQSNSTSINVNESTAGSMTTMPSFHYNQTTTVTGTFTTNTLTQATTKQLASTDDLKRTQSIQEMREMEKRRREEIAGKIDMNEQHTLMSQFEQSFMPKFL